MNIAIVSYKGGVGKTTVVANLAAHLKLLAPALNISAMDLDDQNGLRLHFGLSSKDHLGVADCEDYEDLLSIGEVSPSGVVVYSYGNLAPVERLLFSHKMLALPVMIRAQLDHYLSGEKDLVLIDTPPGDNAAVRQAIMAADIILVVLNTDGASFATVGLIDELVPDIRTDFSMENIFYLLNDYDERRELDRDVLEVMKRRFGGKLAPVALHYDPSIREAFACCSLLHEYADDSHVNHELSTLAGWLLEREA